MGGIEKSNSGIILNARCLAEVVLYLQVLLWRGEAEGAGMNDEQDERTLNMHVNNKFVVPFHVHVEFVVVVVVVVVYSAGVAIGVVVVTDLHKLIKIIAARNANSWSVRSIDRWLLLELISFGSRRSIKTFYLWRYHPRSRRMQWGWVGQQ